MAQIQDELFKMAVKDEEQYNQLLAFYRSKIQEFERERLEWLQKIEEIRISYEEKHQLQWELGKRKDEIAELQLLLSESKMMLFEERQSNLRLIRENDQLKIVQLEDRRRLGEGMQINSPIDEQIILQRDLKPELTQKYITNDLSLNYKKQQKPKGVKMSQQTQSKVKTIYLPNEQLNSVAVENENLKKLIDQSQQLLVQQSSALRQEIDTINSESALRRADDQNNLRSQLERIQKLERHNVEIIKDFYADRLSWSEKERNIQEENNIVRQRNLNLAKQLDDVTHKTAAENRAAVNLIEKKNEEHTKKFRKQVQQKDENLNIIKEQYTQVQQIYVQKIRQLEESLSKLVDKYQSLEKRRQLEIEGFKTDIKKLNQRLKDYEYNYNNIQSQKEPYQKDEIRRFQEEADKLKEDALRKTQKAYSPAKQLTRKKQNKSQKEKSLNKTSKRQEQDIEHQIQKLDNEDYENELNEQESSLPIQDLEDIQRQLEELECKMDIAKKM